MRPAEHVVFQQVEGEMILLDLNAEKYFSLDEVGARIWQLLGEHGDVEDVVRAMLAEFDVDAPTLRRDLDELLERLAAAGLLV